MIIKAPAKNQEEVTIRVALESEAFGREYFEYDNWEETAEAVVRLGKRAAEESAKDGIERQVTVAVVPETCYGYDDGYGYGLEDADEDDAD